MKDKRKWIKRTLWLFFLHILISLTMVKGIRAESQERDLIEETGALLGYQMYIGNDEGLFVIDRQKSSYNILEEESIEQVAEGREPGYVYYTLKSKEGLYRLDEKRRRMKILDGQVDGFAFTKKGLYYQQGEAFYLLCDGSHKKIFSDLMNLQLQSVESSGEKAYFMDSSRIVQGNLLTGELITLLDITKGVFRDVEVMEKQLYCIVEDASKRILIRVELPSKKVLEAYMDGRYQFLHRQGDKIYTLMKNSSGQVYVEGIDVAEGEITFSEELSKEVTAVFFDGDRLVANREFMLDLQSLKTTALDTAMEEAMEQKAKTTKEAKDYLALALEKSVGRRRIYVKNTQHNEYGQQWIDKEQTYNFSKATEELLSVTKAKATTSTDEFEEFKETYYKGDMYFYRYGKDEKYSFSYLEEYQVDQLQNQYVWGLLNYLSNSNNLYIRKETGQSKVLHN